MSSDFSSPMRRVAIYGRVSTPHEAQISAMDNQKQWYEDEAARHDNWIVVARYYDEGHRIRDCIPYCSRGAVLHDRRYSLHG